MAFHLGHTLQATLQKTSRETRKLEYPGLQVVNQSNVRLLCHNIAHKLILSVFLPAGLDPAGPSFSGAKSTNRLDVEDAHFVDVIHTCVGRSGIMESIGHVDFFRKH